MTKFKRSWLIPWEGGQIGIAYVTKSGNGSMRMFQEKDPDTPALLEALSDDDRQLIESHMPKVVPFRRLIGTLPP